jgi:hypothetical protein
MSRKRFIGLETVVVDESQFQPSLYARVQT